MNKLIVLDIRPKLRDRIASLDAKLMELSRQNLECDRRQDKEVDRRDAVDVIAEKRPPALRRWPRVAAHVPSDRRLGDLEAELEQLTMNTRCAPKCVRTAHFANERSQFRRPSVCQH